MVHSAIPALTPSPPLTWATLVAQEPGEEGSPADHTLGNKEKLHACPSPHRRRSSQTMR